MDTVIIAFAALSWGVEILADRQKSVWKAGQTEGRHQEKFITSGLWSISRHPK
jgi:steroid 5-alpha reductase family enzyme